VVSRGSVRRTGAPLLTRIPARRTGPKT
jgi:hypothetical protein